MAPVQRPKTGPQKTRSPVEPGYQSTLTWSALHATMHAELEGSSRVGRSAPSSRCPKNAMAESLFGTFVVGGPDSRSRLPVANPFETLEIQVRFLSARGTAWVQ